MLSAESLKQIDIELAKYPADQRRSAIMGALRIAQTEKGWLAPETIAFVADYIGISPAQAYRRIPQTKTRYRLRRNHA